MLRAIVLCLCLAAPAAATPVVLYDIDFRGIAEGSAVPIDTGPFPRIAPSSCRSCESFGSIPRITSGFPGLGDQAVELLVDANPRIAQEQINLEVPDHFTSYRLEADVIATDFGTSIGSGLSIFFDAPQIIPVRVVDGAVSLPFTRFVPIGPGVHHVVMEIDFVARTLFTSFGSASSQGPLDPVFTALRSIRFGISGTGTRIGVDNIRVTAVPEISIPVALACAALIPALSTRWRRQLKGPAVR